MSDGRRHRTTPARRAQVPRRVQHSKQRVALIALVFFLQQLVLHPSIHACTHGFRVPPPPRTHAPPTHQSGTACRRGRTTPWPLAADARANPPAATACPLCSAHAWVCGAHVQPRQRVRARAAPHPSRPRSAPRQSPATRAAAPASAQPGAYQTPAPRGHAPRASIGDAHTHTHTHTRFTHAEGGATHIHKVDPHVTLEPLDVVVAPMQHLRACAEHKNALPNGQCT